VKYLVTNNTEACYNLAFEEYILNNYKDDDYLILWQNDNTIVVGVNQNPLEEINTSLAEQMGVNIVRRSTGGGTVYHDMGNLNFSFITDWNEFHNADYESFLRPVMEAFKKIGVVIELKGRNDLLIDGKKISGSAQSLVSGRILHHGTLLIDSDLDVIGKLLNVTTDKIQSKGIKSVRSRVTNIKDYVSQSITVESVKELLIRQWFGKDEEPMQLSHSDLAEIKLIADNKYRTWEWTYSRSPKFSFRNSRRFPGGSLEVNLDVKDGIIDKCMFTGDFLSMKSVREVENALKWVKYDRKYIYKIFESLPVNLYFGSITTNEIIDCFFD